MTKFVDWIFAGKSASDLNRAVLTTNQNTYTLADIEKEMDRLIAHLKQKDLNGKKIGILIPSIFHYIVLVLAVNKLGGTVIPISGKLRRQDLNDVLQLLSPHMIFTVKDHQGFDFHQVIEEWATSEEKQIVIFETNDYAEWSTTVFSGEEPKPVHQKMDIIGCSSGSTGVPKGIVINSRALSYWINWLEYLGEVVPEDRIYLTIPYTAPYGLSWLLTGLKNQFEMVIAEQFDLFEIMNLIDKRCCNKIISTPSIFKSLHLFAEKANISIFERVELCGFSGEIITKEFIDSLTSLRGKKFVGIFGLSEIGGVMENLDLAAGLDWSINKQVEYRISWVDEDEQIGEIQIRTPGAFDGYYGRPDLTAQVMSDDGWFFTGDLVRVKGPGIVEVVGRKKDLIKKGGQQVIPGEVERVLLQYPGILQAVVVGVPHEIFGEQVVAFIQTGEKVEEKEIVLYCSQRLAMYKVPDVIEQVTGFPEVQGKIDKLALRRMVLERQR